MSSLQYWEWVYLTSTLLAIDNRRFLCSDCKGLYHNTVQYEEKQKIERAAKRCQTISPDPKRPVYNQGDFLYLTCPGNFFSPVALQWLEMHGNYERGMLPFPGAFMDQPNKMIEVFRVIQTHKDKIREERTREAERRAEATHG